MPCSGINVFTCSIVVQPGGPVEKNNYMSGSCVGQECVYSFYTKPSRDTTLRLAMDGKVGLPLSLPLGTCASVLLTCAVALKF